MLLVCLPASVSAGPRPAAPLPPVRLAPLEAPPDTLTAADLQRLSLRLSAALGERYRVLPPCSAASCPAKVARVIGRLLVDAKAAAASRCHLRLLLIAPPLLPRRVDSAPAACDAAALTPGLDAALRKLLPTAGGEAEAASRPARGIKGATPSPRARQRGAAKRARAAAAPATKRPALPFRDRFRMSIGALLTHRERELGTSSSSDVSFGLQAAVEIYPFAGSRQDRWADLGLELRYARLFQNGAMGAHDWLEALFRFRWNVSQRNGGAELALALGWGMQALHGHDSGTLLIDGEPLYAHNLTAQLRGWLPFARRRAWWLGLRAEASLLLLLPAVDVGTTTAAALIYIGPEFSYRGVSARLELLYRRSSFQLSASDQRVGERALGGLLSLHYAL
jgi:hypothetical protein